MANKTSSDTGNCACQGHDPGRRELMRGAVSLALLPLAAMCGSALAQAPTAAPASGARSKRPEPGDRLAFMTGEKEGQKVMPSDVEFGKDPVLAYPMDPASGEVYSSRVNMIAIARLKPEDLGEKVAPHAAEGVVAYSALCTHYGCPVTSIHPSHTSIVCNCHGTVFDAANNGVVLSGPATRRLPLLPLSIVDGDLVVAGKFNGPLGPPT